MSRIAKWNESGLLWEQNFIIQFPKVCSPKSFLLLLLFCNIKELTSQKVHVHLFIAVLVQLLSACHLFTPLCPLLPPSVNSKTYFILDSFFLQGF